MSSVQVDIQEEVAQARLPIPGINNKCVAEMRALLSVLENNTRDFKTLVQKFEVVTEENIDCERVGALIRQAEYQEFLPYVIKEAKSRRTVFSGWLMATTRLLIPPNVLDLERDIVCMALQKFIVTDEIGQILIDALKATEALLGSRTNQESPAVMRQIAHRLLIEMYKQITTSQRPALTNLFSLLGDCGTVCSCRRDFGGVGFKSDGEDNGATLTADRDLEAFMAHKKLESSDSIVQRPSGDASPPKAEQTKKRKTTK